MGKKIGASCVWAACIVAMAVLQGCQETFDIIVINSTDDTIVVQLDRNTPFTVGPNSYEFFERGISHIRAYGYDFEVFSEDGRLLGTIEILEAQASKDLHYNNRLYVLTVVVADLMTVEESIAFEAAREDEFVVIAMVELESEDRVVQLFKESGTEIEGYRIPNRFFVEVMRRDRVRAMELLEQDATANDYAHWWAGDGLWPPLPTSSDGKQQSIQNQNEG